MKTAENQAQFVDLLLKVSRKLRILFDARIRRHGLTLARARALMALKDQDDFYQKNLAEELEIENATLVRIIDALEAQGLVSRDVSADDRRAKFVTLTRQGRELVDGIEVFAAEVRRDVMAGIADKDMAAALSVLDHMADTIEKEARL